MTKPQISICLPCLDSNNWEQIYQSIESSLAGRYSFEFLPVGPFNLTTGCPKNTRYIRDFGCPARAINLGALIAEAPLFTWLSADCLYFPGALAKTIDYFLSNSTGNDGCIIKYYEGQAFESNELIDSRMQDSYYLANYHDATRLDFLPPYFLNCPVGLYRLKTWEEFGGLDCSMEHCNMNCSLLAHDIQHMGNKMHISPCVVMRAGFDPNNTLVWSAFHDNDLEVFRRVSKEHHDYKLAGCKPNWKDVPSVWPRRWGTQ